MHPEPAPNAVDPLRLNWCAQGVFHLALAAQSDSSERFFRASATADYGSFDHHALQSRIAHRQI